MRPRRAAEGGRPPPARPPASERSGAGCGDVAPPAVGERGTNACASVRLCRRQRQRLAVKRRRRSVFLGPFFVTNVSNRAASLLTEPFNQAVCDRYEHQQPPELTVDVYPNGNCQLASQLALAAPRNNFRRRQLRFSLLTTTNDKNSGLTLKTCRFLSLVNRRRPANVVSAQTVVCSSTRS